MTDHNETWDEVEKLRGALRNCLLLAMRNAHRARGSDWEHIIRFCTEAGCGPSPLRAEKETSPAPNTKGSFGSECNRASCKNVPATWKHRDLQTRYYCEPCGQLINKHNGEELCSPANR